MTGCVTGIDKQCFSLQYVTTMTNVSNAIICVNHSKNYAIIALGAEHTWKNL